MNESVFGFPEDMCFAFFNETSVLPILSEPSVSVFQTELFLPFWMKESDLGFPKDLFFAFPNEISILRI